MPLPNQVAEPPMAREFIDSSPPASAEMALEATSLLKMRFCLFGRETRAMAVGTPKS